MSSSRSNGGANFRSSAHGGRNGTGFVGRAKNIHTKLSKSLHPDLDGMGVEVDIPDLVDRIKNGNQFTEGGNLDGLKAYENEEKKRIGFSVLTAKVCPNKNVGIAIDVGTLKGTIDGVGVNYKACGVAANVALGPVDIGSKLGTAEAGAKLWQPGVGLDAGIKVNASAAKLHAGPFKAGVGVGIDTGVKFGKEGVGVEVMGTGVQIGRTVGVSLFGSSLSVKLW